MAGFGVGLLVGALRVMTSTPDALCPPLKAAEEALAARVGEVAGKELVLHFRVARGSDGVEVLIVDLTASAVLEPLLHRELPLSELSCADAATVIALQVENYFATIGPAEEVEQTPASPVKERAPEHAPVQITEARPPVGAAVPPALPTRSDERNVSPALPEPAFRIEGRLGIIWSAVPTLGVGFRQDVGRGWNLSLQGSLSLREQTFTSEEVSGRAYVGWVSASAGYRWSRGKWRWSLGPTVTFMLQSARATGPGLSGASLAEKGSAFRVVPGFGAEAQGEFWSGRSLGLLLGFEAGPLVGGWAPSFRVQRTSEAESIEVLRPPGFFFLGWVGLAVSP